MGLLTTVAICLFVVAASALAAKQKEPSQDADFPGLYTDPKAVGIDLEALGVSPDSMRAADGSKPKVFFQRQEPGMRAPELSTHCYETITEIRKVVKTAKASGGSPLWKSERLRLSDCQLARLPDELGELGNLEYIDVSNNRLTALPDTMAQLTKLKYLRISGESYGAQVPAVVKRLSSLEVLELVDMGLSALPPWLGGLRNLQVLNVYDNKLRALPKELAALAKLEVFNLSNNSLSSVPDWLCSLTALSELTLSENELKALPDCIGDLVNLVWLPLFNNKLTALPASMAKLTGLRALHVYGNALSTLPDMSRLTEATSVDIARNQLTAVPEFIRALAPTLESLRLWDNKIKAMPQWIGELSKLKDLDFFSNRISELPTSLRNLENLERLVLSNNDLPSVNPALFSRMRSLTTLGLFENPFTFDGTGLPDGWCSDPKNRFFTLVKGPCEDIRQVREGTYEPCMITRK